MNPTTNLNTDLAALVGRHAALANATALATSIERDSSAPAQVLLRFADPHTAAEFVNSALALRPPAAPAPAPFVRAAEPEPTGDAMPYSVFNRPVMHGDVILRHVACARYAHGSERELTDDEAAVAKHVEALELRLAGDVLANVPPLPYSVTHRHYGVGNPPPLRAAKVRTGLAVGPDELLTDDERAVWLYLQTLQARAQAANALDAAEITNDAPERAQRDAGAPEGQLEMVPEGETAEGETGPTLRERVVAALLADASASNVAIGEQHGCSAEFVRLRRRELEAAGTLAPVPVKRSDGSLYSRSGAE